MNAFVRGVQLQTGSASANVDFFYKAGASRGGNIVPIFSAAYAENPELALRNAQWLRDVRGGAGERALFRDIIKWLEQKNPSDAIRLLNKIPLVGRWDDIFQFQTQMVKSKAFDMLGDALRMKDGLAAKWTPRQGALAAEIRKHFGMSPKFYRKSLVELTNVVEQKMCAKEWDEINFSHVPSVAHSRYKKAFGKNAPSLYAAYVAQLVSGADPDVKINANAIFPHDVLKGFVSGYVDLHTEQEKKVVKAQWEALPNYVGDGSILPLVDVSGSMTCALGRGGSKTNLTCLDVAVSLGLYLSDKNKGPFKDTFLTFSSEPVLMHLKGDIFDKITQMNNSSWAMSTNIEKAFLQILKVAQTNKVPQSDMPKILMIMSDMQFNGCIDKKEALPAVELLFKAAGYEIPKVVFWNLNDSGSVPVAFDKSGAALVSGYSPSIVKPILEADFSQFTPEAIMMKALQIPRYDLS